MSRNIAILVLILAVWKRMEMPSFATGLHTHTVCHVALSIGLRADQSGNPLFTRALARQVAEDGIRVNCVASGPVWTPR